MLGLFHFRRFEPHSSDGASPLQVLSEKELKEEVTAVTAASNTPPLYGLCRRPLPLVLLPRHLSTAGFPTAPTKQTQSPEDGTRGSHKTSSRSYRSFSSNNNNNSNSRRCRRSTISLRNNTNKHDRFLLLHHRLSNANLCFRLIQTKHFLTETKHTASTTITLNTG
jgi:hypothetical protein